MGNNHGFSGVEADGDSRLAAVAAVGADSVGKGRARLDKEAIHRLGRLVGKNGVGPSRR